MMSVLANECAVPEMDLTVVLTGDITASIRAHSESDRNFTPERSGGIVEGKTIEVVRDFSQTVIVIDIDTGTETADEELDEAELLHLVMHEYGHALLGRLRAGAGTRPPKTTRSKTPEEVAAIWAYEAAHEFRCDLLSNTLLAKFATTTDDDGATRPFTFADLVGEGYRDAFASLLDHVHPGWPDLVFAYQTHQIDLDEMYEGLLHGTGGVLKLIAHADAVEETGGNAPLLAGFADHPAVREIPGPIWGPIRKVLDTSPIMPSLDEFAAVDNAVQEHGERMVTVWQSLGVSALDGRRRVLGDRELRMRTKCAPCLTRSHLTGQRVYPKDCL
ncbi:hypothetical protein [Streptomyces albipurpureus]|uniref:Uncharacterized protein n=1 Tax=Streptomyces albipurpureus TaxID=2897419 RepID=A0ABT0UJ77_9ACTN|nr:hypothetical protein [Streptomyces sp. CWNU-1]MCM2388145.1 hypothetical protein [Streptomyces sp. CWNU-1]